MNTSHTLRRALPLAAVTLVATTLGACASKPAAEVSRDQMTAVRQSYSDLKIGASRDAVLNSFKSGNKVKLGSSEIGGMTVEEWKVEAFHDEDKRKDLFVTFLYFCNDRLVDSSDTRIDYRANDALLGKWQSAAKK